jgi:RNA-splicing ligase RtcB
MPDTHAGKGCVIGFTADLGDKVVPNLVGVDVGCGCYCANLGKLCFSDLGLANLDNFIQENIPAGLEVNTLEHSINFSKMNNLKMFDHLRNVDHLKRSIPSLGGGNHYIELDKDSEDNVYLCIHTGSRNLGKQVCDYYQNIAVKRCNDHKIDEKAIIDKLKSEGRQKEISSIIANLKNKYKSVPKDLCWLEGKDRDDYLHDMRICQEFAMLNRESIAIRIFDFLKISFIEKFHSIHNYIDFEDGIVRKGAIRCNKNEKAIIPLNMKDGAIIGIGKGNEDWNNSAPHGAGRLMSRTKAKESISIEDFRRSMKGIYTTSVSESTLDESPMAYKDADEIVELVKDTIDIIDIIKPIYNFKSA